MDLLSSIGSSTFNQGLKLGKPKPDIHSSNHCIYRKYIKRINKFHHLIREISIPKEIKVDYFEQLKKNVSKYSFVDTNLLNYNFKIDHYIISFYYFFTFTLNYRLDFYLIIRITSNGQEIQVPYVSSYDSFDPKEVYQYLMGQSVQLKLPKYWMDEEYRSSYFPKNSLYAKILLNSSLYKAKTDYVVEEKGELKVEKFHKKFFGDNKFEISLNDPKFEILMETKSKGEQVIENSFTYLTYGNEPKSQTYTVNTSNQISINSKSITTQSFIDEDLDAIEGELLDTTNIPLVIQMDSNQDIMYGYKAAKVKHLDKYQPCIVKLLIPTDAKCAFSIEETKIRVDKAIPIKIMRFVKETYIDEEPELEEVAELVDETVFTKLYGAIYNKVSNLIKKLPLHKGDKKIPDDVPFNDEEQTKKFLTLVNQSILTEADIPTYYSLTKYILEEEHKVAYSCIMVDDFVYEIGKLITIENFDGDLTKVCVPGIHFYFRQEEAFSWHGLPNLMDYQIEHYDKMEQFKPTFNPTN